MYDAVARPSAARAGRRVQAPYRAPTTASDSREDVVPAAEDINVKGFRR
jgi:hypothetical protein